MAYTIFLKFLGIIWEKTLIISKVGKLNRTESPKTDKTGTNDSLYFEIVTELRKKLMLAKSKEGEQSRLNSQF